MTTTTAETVREAQSALEFLDEPSSGGTWSHATAIHQIAKALKSQSAELERLKAEAAGVDVTGWRGWQNTNGICLLWFPEMGCCGATWVSGNGTMWEQAGICLETIQKHTNGRTELHGPALASLIASSKAWQTAPKSEQAERDSQPVNFKAASAEGAAGVPLGIAYHTLRTALQLNPSKVYIEVNAGFIRTILDELDRLAPAPAQPAKLPGCPWEGCPGHAVPSETNPDEMVRCSKLGCPLQRIHFSFADWNRREVGGVV